MRKPTQVKRAVATRGLRIERPVVTEPETQAAIAEAPEPHQEDAPGTIVEERLPKLAGAKVTRALRAIRSCRTLARYKPTPKQSEAIAEAIAHETDTLKSLLSAGQTKAIEFVLPFDS